MSFEAKYRGRCSACDEQISPGDRVQYDDDELVHEDCDDAAPAPEEAAPVCTTCWLTKPCGCEDT